MAASTFIVDTAQGHGAGLTAKAYNLTSPHALATNGASSASTEIAGQPGLYLFTFTNLATGIYRVRIVTAADLKIASGRLNHTDAIGVEEPYIDLSGTTVGGIAGTIQTLDALWNKIKKWLQLLIRKDAAIAADNATELTEINANGGSGAGGYVNTAESIEAIAVDIAVIPVPGSNPNISTEITVIEVD